MFNLIASGLQAYNQVGIFIGALICLGFGGLILGNSLYWRVYAIRVTGTILGVLPDGKVFAPVYRYTGPDGREHEAKSNTSSSSVRRENTGRMVSLLVSAHDPAEARECHDYSLDVIGLAFLVAGFWLAYLSVVVFPITLMTWIVSGGFAAFGAERLYRMFRSSGTRLSPEQWKQHRGTFDLSRLEPAESVAENSGTSQNQRVNWAANRKLSIPLFAIFASVLAAAGSFEMLATYRLETTGLRTEGEIVRLVESSSGSNSGPSYYPVVRFRTADNHSIEFQDRIGSNPPARRAGDRVSVLYLLSSPKSSIIDRGWFINWLIPGLLLAAAMLIVFVLLKMLRATPAAVTAQQHI